MSLESLINPKYSEEEVWQLLTEYLEKKFNADPNTIQRGIYVEHYSDGSFFSTLKNKNNLGRLLCNRNIYFNISGIILFSDSSRDENFTLSEICTYLKKPFPKQSFSNTNEAESTSDYNKKQIKNNIISQKEEIENLAIQISYAFEYHRAKELKNSSIYHLNQLINSINDLSFIYERKIQNTENIFIIHPEQPSISEINIFYNNYINSLKESVYLNKSTILDYVSTDIIPNYSKFFSDEIRNIGTALIPINDLNGNIISAIAVNNIIETESKKHLFMINKDDFNGSYQLNYKNMNTDSEFIFLTKNIDTADCLSLSTKFPIYASITEDNLITLFHALKESYPNSYIILVLDNPYIKYTKNIDSFHFKDELIIKLMFDFLKNQNNLIGTCCIYPPILDEENEASIESFSDLYVQNGLIDFKFYLNQELNDFKERISKNINEAENIETKHLEMRNLFINKYGINLPKLIDEDTIKHHQKINDKIISNINEAEISMPIKKDNVLNNAKINNLCKSFEEDKISKDYADQTNELDQQLFLFSVGDDF